MSNLPAQQKEHPLLMPNVIEEVKNDVFNVVNASIAQCYAHLNYAVPADANYLVNEVTNSIIKNYPSLRMQEIPVAFSNGIRHKYGEYFGLCVVSFEMFINGYLNSPERTELVKEKIKLIEEKIEPTPNEKFTMGKQLCVDLYEKFKKSGQLDRTALSVYEFLSSINLIDPEYKKGIYNQALEETIAEKIIDISLCMDIHKRRGLNQQLECFKDNISKDILTAEQHGEVQRTARKMVLKNILFDMATEDQNMAELIEMKRAIYIK